MSFQEDFIHGYTKHENNFNNWCQKSSKILGKVTQCGIVETNNTGHALIAINRPDFGEEYIDKQNYIIDSHMTYSKNDIEGFRTQYTNEGIQFMQNNEEALYGKKFDLWYGFTYLEKIDDNTNRQYYFGSDSSTIYNKLLNNTQQIKELIQQFKADNEHIIDYYRDRKFNIAQNKQHYFIDKPYNPTAKDKLSNLLKSMNILKKDQTITNIEWRLLKSYLQTSSLRQTADVLGISKHQAEYYFFKMKDKFKTNRLMHK